MAQVELVGARIEFPHFPYTMGTLSVLTGINESNLMNSVSDKNSFLIVCPQAGDIKQVHVVFPTITTGDDIIFSLQDLNATTGDPDGTQDQFRVKSVVTGDAGNRIASGIISDDGMDGGVLRTVTKGQKLYVVLEFDSWVAGNMVLAIGSLETGWIGYPAVKESTSTEQAVYPNIAIEYDSGGIVPVVGCFPYEGFTSITLGTGTTPDEIGSKFQVPFDMRLQGIVTPAFDSGDIDIQIENAGGSVLAGPASYHFEPNDTTTTNKKTIFFDTPIDLVKDTDYYFVLKTTSATTGLVKTLDITSGMLAAFPGGTNWPYVSRVDAGAWSESATTKMMFSLIASGFSDGSGAAPTCNFAGLVNGTRVVPLAGE